MHLQLIPSFNFILRKLTATKIFLRTPLCYHIKVIITYPIIICKVNRITQLLYFAWACSNAIQKSYDLDGTVNTQSLAPQVTVNPPSPRILWWTAKQGDATSDDLPFLTWVTFEALMRAHNLLRNDLVATSELTKTEVSALGDIQTLVKAWGSWSFDYETSAQRPHNVGTNLMGTPHNFHAWCRVFLNPAKKITVPSSQKSANS